MTSTDDWDVASLDLDAYLDRIGHPRVPSSAGALRSLHEAHVRAIPFENVGYCDEHDLLLAAVLEQLGYPVQRRIARVQPHRAGPRTHMMLAVSADGVDYLVDVGFGAGMLYPMPLQDGGRGRRRRAPLHLDSSPLAVHRSADRHATRSRRQPSPRR